MSKSIDGTIEELQECHDFLVESARRWFNGLPEKTGTWGIRSKGILVQLSSGQRPKHVGKNQEAFSEILNMTATVERMLAVLNWSKLRPEYRDCIIMECHPTTSDSLESNDLVFGKDGNKILLCEICDIAAVAPSATHNGKERSDLKKLGYGSHPNYQMPTDHIDRFIATSSPFAEAIANKKRSLWKTVGFRYEPALLNDEGKTVLLKIVSGPIS